MTATTGPRTGDGPLLEVRDLACHFPVRLPGRPDDGLAARLLGRPGVLRAVDGVSLALPAGRTLGIVGESGCGKSTTARTVLGLQAATAGEIRFEGQAVTARRDGTWRALRRRMQMVYQDPLGALDRRLPALSQVAEPLTVFGIGASRAECRARAAELLEAVGLSPRLQGRYPHELSGGQRQRVVLARALVLEPSLLVCDEPTSALDVSIQAQVINLLTDLQARFGVAFLLISHDLKVVRQVSHEVAVMYLGRIVEQGAPDDLFQAPAHPYTRALVSAIPSPWRKEGAQRIVLEGDPPNPSKVPSGCAFHPRCPWAKPVCAEVRPALADVGGGRRAACHLLAPAASAAA